MSNFYTGLPLDEDYCPHFIRIFPSQEREDSDLTNDPLLFSLIVAGVFVFTSLVFLCYDGMVELRQRRVLTKATESSDIVASLFPKAVRDRLYQEAKEDRDRQKQQQQQNKGFVARNKNSSDMTAMLVRDQQNGEVSDDLLNRNGQRTRPIADRCT